MAMMTIREKYEPAMSITDQQEADAYFEKCVRHTMGLCPILDRAQAETLERCNLGYYAGYYDSQTRKRVEALFRCVHPIFGSIEENGEPSEAACLYAGFMQSYRAGL